MPKQVTLLNLLHLIVLIHLLINKNYEGFKKDNASKEEKRVEKQKVFMPREKFEENRKCFKFQGREHITSNCPTKKALTVRKYIALNEEEELYEFVPQEEDHDEYSEEDAYA